MPSRLDTMSIPKPGELPASREFSQAAFGRGADLQARYLLCFKQRPLGNRFLLTTNLLSKHALALPSLGVYHLLNNGERAV
jgi:hypothetical protein